MNIEEIKLKHFKWLNEPKKWTIKDNEIEAVTDENTDFWQETWYKFQRHSGHMFGVSIDEDFVFETCIEADFTDLYDQAGVMIVIDHRRWLKAGVEYSDGRAMISSVLTNGTSDWATGAFAGDPAKFWMRLTRVDAALCVKYSYDAATWHLLRLCPFASGHASVGLACCTPQRRGLRVKFTNIVFTKPVGDILHSN